jgi:glutamyl-Q tRNA(Asp) synthetase
MPVITRFAPSPTGRLHLGHVLAAQVACELARGSAGGKFLLRQEDIDSPRVREEFYAEIEQDLEWLGFHWDGPVLRQSRRVAAYAEALASLRERGLVYPCFCTRRVIQDEWARMGAAPQGEQLPIYPGICRALSAAEQKPMLESGAAHAWRLDSQKAACLTGRLSFHDARLGEIEVRPDLLGDVVLARKDIGTAYHLAVVVDDAFQAVTHVTRGEDLLEATHVHRTLQQLLRLAEPHYHHHRLVLDAAGKRLAKRNDAASIAELRAAGYSASEVLALAKQAGHGHSLIGDLERSHRG